MADARVAEGGGLSLQEIRRPSRKLEKVALTLLIVTVLASPTVSLVVGLKGWEIDWMSSCLLGLLSSGLEFLFGALYLRRRLRREITAATRAAARVLRHELES